MLGRHPGRADRDLLASAYGPRPAPYLLALGVVAIIGNITDVFCAAAAALGLSARILLPMLEETDPKRRARPPAWERHQWR